NAELKAFADNEAFTKAVEQQGGQVSIAPGSLQAGGATGLVTLMVYGMMLEDALSRTGERITAADRGDAAATVRDNFGDGYQTFPRWLRTRLEQRYAAIQAVSRVT